MKTVKFMNKRTGEIISVPIWDIKRIEEIERSGEYKELIKL